VAEVRYLGMELKTQINDEQMKLFLECHNSSAQNMLFKNVNITILIIRLPNVVMYECEALYLTYGKNID
jgi:hypothetical protein